MPLWLLVGIGGFFGGMLRFWLSGWVQSGLVSFPTGTLSVNFIGSLLLGWIMYSSEYAGFLSEEARIFWSIGFLGSFTTMSTFSYESFRMLEQDQLLLFGLNLAATVGLTLLAVYFGKTIAITFMAGLK